MGTNFGEDPQQYSSTRGVAELGYVPGGLKTDTPQWSFGGTSYLMLTDPLRPGIKAIARRRYSRSASLDISAGPMITYDSTGLFNGFTGGIAFNYGFITLRSEYVTWPFDAWDESHYSNGVQTSVEHHPSGHEAVWFNGAAFNGAASWWAFAAVTALVIVAGASGAFE